MATNGGSSKDRRHLDRLAERVSVHLQATAPPQTKDKTLNEPVEPLRELWNSTPLWSGISLLLGLLFTRISLLAVYGTVWILISFEFCRRRLFRSLPLRMLTNVGFTVALAAVLYMVWRRMPPPQVPSSDAAVSRLADRLDKGLQSLVRPPDVTAHATDKQQATKNPSDPDLHRPWIALSRLGTSKMESNPYPFLTLGEIEINTGDEPAKAVRTSGDIFVGEAGSSTEDQIFATLRKRNKEQGGADKAPRESQAFEIGGLGSPRMVDGLPIPMNQANVITNAVYSGKMLLYIAVLAQYMDAHGLTHYTEQCLAGHNLEDVGAGGMQPCTNHNVRK